MNTRRLFNTSAIVEILTGLALLVVPSLVIRLLLGEGLGLTCVAVARVLGVGLLALGVAAWETPPQMIRLAPRVGICIYNVGTAVLLMILGVFDGLNGALLWPTAVLHGLLGAAMLWVMLAPSRPAGDP